MTEVVLPISTSQQLGDGKEIFNPSLSKGKESWTEWVERHKTILSICLSIFSLLIMVALLLVINFVRADEDDEEVSERKLRAFAATLIPKNKPKLEWDQIAGLKETKQSLQEAAVWPLRKPELFTGLRAAHRGILLYGPPGTGKTMLVKALAHATKSTFMVVTASDIAKKYLGSSEKRMNMIFKAAALFPSTVIFMDEIEALTGTRGKHASSGSMDRALTEFLTGMDGLTSDVKRNILVIGATNTPELVDEAVIRRLPRRIYVPLPDESSRMQQLKLEIEGGNLQLTEKEYRQIAKDTEGYSGSDLSSLIREAAIMGLREAFENAKGNIDSVRKDNVRGLVKEDFDKARDLVSPSVLPGTVRRLENWKSKSKRPPNIITNPAPAPSTPPTIPSTPPPGIPPDDNIRDADDIP